MIMTTLRVFEIFQQIIIIRNRIIFLHFLESVCQTIVKTDYFLAKSDNLAALYIEYVVDGSATGRVVYAKVNDEDGLIEELRYDSPLKHKISFR
jgi:hypothetical protein